MSKKKLLAILSSMALLASIICGNLVLSQASEDSTASVARVLYDGAAETDTSGCRTWICNEDGTGAFAVDSTTLHNSKSSLKLSATANNIVDVNYSVNASVKTGETLKLSGFVKTENLISASGNGAKVVMNGAGLSTSDYSGTRDWTYFEVSKTLTSDVTLGDLCYDITWSTGAAWFQGVKVEVVTVDANVLYDGAAERDTSGCRAWICNEDGSGSYAVDSTQVHDGKPSLKLSATAVNIVDVNYTVNKDVASGATLKLSGYVKTDNLSGNGAKIVMNGAGMETPAYSGTHDWTYFEVTKTMTADVTLGDLCYDVQWSTGSVWFQGVKVEVITVDPNVLYEGIAERDTSGCRAWIWNEATGSYAVDSTQVHDGKPSLKLSATVSNIVDVNYNLNKTVLSGSTLTLSGYIKTDNLVSASGEGAKVVMNGADLRTSNYSGTMDWTYFEVTKTLTTDVTLGDLCYDITWSTGSAWFQDVKLVVSTPSTETTATTTTTTASTTTTTASATTASAASTTTTTSASTTDPDVLYASTAESSTADCRIWICNEDGTGAAAVDSTVTHNDKSSLKLSATATNIVDVNYGVNKNVASGATLKLSGYVKTENLVSSSGAGAKVVMNGASMQTPNYSGTINWTYFEVTKTLTEDVTLGELCYDITWCTGSVWFQGVTVEIVTDSSDEDDNVIYDGAAESDITGYRTWCANEGDASKTATVSVDTTVTHNGKSSLKFTTQSTTTIQDLYIENLNVSFAVGDKVKLSGYIKTENLVTTDAGVRFAMSGDHYTTGLSGTNDWTYVEKTFTITKAIENASFYYSLYWSTGTAWFQGFKVERVTATSDVLYDADAESAAAFAGYRTWLYSGDGAVTAAVSLDTTVTHNDKPSIKFTATTSSIADMYIPLNYTVEKGKAIKISGWIKTDNIVTTGSGMRFVLQKDVNGTTSEVLSVGSVSGTTDWTYFEKVYSPVEDTLIAQAFLNMNWCTGSAWVQGFKVELTDETTVPDDPGDVPYLPAETTTSKDIFSAVTTSSQKVGTGSTSQTPNTGDVTPVVLLITAFVGSLTVLLITNKTKKKKESD